MISAASALPPPTTAAIGSWGMPVVTTLLVAVGLLVAMVGMRRAERRRREQMLRDVLSGIVPEPGAVEAAPELRDRGRPATLRRRRGGEWDTPVVPTVSTSPHRRNRRRTRRV